MTLPATQRKAGPYVGDDTVSQYSFAFATASVAHLTVVEADAAGKKMGMGYLLQRLWETVEVQAAHIDQLLARVEALEGGSPA